MKSWVDHSASELGLQAKGDLFWERVPRGRFKRIGLPQLFPERAQEKPNAPAMTLGKMWPLKPHAGVLAKNQVTMHTTATYCVRPFKTSDAESMLIAVRSSLPSLAYWMPWCKESYALEDAKAWIQFAQTSWANKTEFPLGIFETQSGAVVGGTGINQINKPFRIGNLGYWVSTPHTGRGVARYAARQAALLGFKELCLTRLEIVVLSHNLASQKVAESLGAQRECLARNRLYHQGQPHDGIVYSLIPQDMRAASLV